MIKQYRDALAAVREDLAQKAHAKKYGSTDLALLNEALYKLETLEKVSDYYFNKMCTFRNALTILKDFFKVSKDIDSKTYELHTTFPEYVYINQNQYEILKEVLSEEKTHIKIEKGNFEIPKLKIEKLFNEDYMYIDKVRNDLATQIRLTTDAAFKDILLKWGFSGNFENIEGVKEFVNDNGIYTEYDLLNQGYWVHNKKLKAATFLGFNIHFEEKIKEAQSEIRQVSKE